MSTYLPTIKQLQYLVALHEHGHFGRAADASFVSQSTLSAGIRFERRVFHAMFATADQKEGMAAFVEKRPPSFKDR